MNAQKDWTSAGYTRCSEDPSSANYHRWWAAQSSWFENLEYVEQSESGQPMWLRRISSYPLWINGATEAEQSKRHTQMEQRAAAVLADIFAAMPNNPTLDEIDAELRAAMSALNYVEYLANSTRPKGTPRMHLRPTGLLLQALTEQYYKCDAGEVFEVGA